MLELELRQQRGTLPQDMLVATVADRQQPLGSGGATLNALLVAAEHLSNRAGHTVSWFERCHLQLATIIYNITLLSGRFLNSPKLRILCHLIFLH